MLPMLSRSFTFFFLLAACTVATTALHTEAPADGLLRQARTLFYRSIDNEELIPRTEMILHELRQLDGYEGRAVTYLGALTALKGKHAFWPHDKWQLANEGIAQMDRGVALSPDDIEALFIHGSTCYYLPFFFNRADDAQRKFRRILRLLPGRLHAYDPALMRNVTDFLAQNADFDAQQREQLSSLQRQLAAGQETDRQ